ncbi:MAG: phosphoribosylformylglycinamidine synthase II, partial [Candidatus Thermoplasmatota archaeon]
MGDRYVRKRVPFPLVAIHLSDASDAELTHISGDLALALSLTEMRRVQAYFRAQHREPTDVELQSLGQAWSEHCCYKSSKVFLREFIFPVQTPDVLDRGDAGVME